MLKEAIFHRPEGAYAHPAGSRALRVRLRARRGDLTACHLLHGDRYGQGKKRRTFSGWKRWDRTSSSTGLRGWFLRPPAVFVTPFTWRAKEGGLWYGERGLSPERGEAGIFQYPYLCEGDLFRVPEWAKDGIVYQIFPDRFCNGDKGNDPGGTEPWEPGGPAALRQLLRGRSAGDDREVALPGSAGRQRALSHARFFSPLPTTNTIRRLLSGGSRLRGCGRS